MAIFKPLLNVEYVLSLNDLVGEPTLSKLVNDDGSPMKQVRLQGQLHRPTKERIMWYAQPWKLERIILAGILPGEEFKLQIAQKGDTTEFNVTPLNVSGR